MTVRRPPGALALLATLAVLAVAVAGPAYANPDYAQRELVVTGSGKVAVKADTALVSLGAETTRPTFAEATGEVMRRMSAALAALKALGIADGDITTVTYAIDSRTEAGRVVGYQVTHVVRVKVRKLDGVATVVEAAVAAGANTVRGVSYDVDDPSALIARARTLAVRDAAAKAWQLASAAGAWLDGVLTISEGPVQIGHDGGARAEPGQLEVDVTVTVRYGLLILSPYSRIFPPMF